MVEEKILLTPKQVASAIGCETAYLKEHESELGLESAKTPGGHRRYALDDVQRLVDRLAVVRETDVALARLLILKRRD
jgi:DNA-binding transcriptional MerR regulator